MRIVCISDTHGLHDRIKVPHGDVLIHAGDACNTGKLTDFQNFSVWFLSQPHRYKIFVPGNHDRICELEPLLCKRMLEHANGGVFYLSDSMVTFSGLRVYGTPWQPEFCNWAFNLTEAALYDKFAAIPSNLDILISHGPPHGVGDRTDYSKKTIEHLGSKSLRDRLKSLANPPRFHVFGHIHGGYGIHATSGTTVSINAAVCNERYEAVNAPIVFFS